MFVDYHITLPIIIGPRRRYYPIVSTTVSDSDYEPVIKMYLFLHQNTFLRNQVSFIKIVVIDDSNLQYQAFPFAYYFIFLHAMLQREDI